VIDGEGGECEEGVDFYGVYSVPLVASGAGVGVESWEGGTPIGVDGGVGEVTGVTVD
jgi:hypothetical protein